MKNKIIDYHPILGPITYEDLINDLNILLEDYNTLEDIILNIMEYSNFDAETISSLFNDNISSRLEWIIFVLKGLL